MPTITAALSHFLISARTSSEEMASVLYATTME